ncbi:MAG: hypothetical protein ACE15F_24675, partial [bacterium]
GEGIGGVVFIDHFEETRTGELKKSTHWPNEPFFCGNSGIVLQRRPGAPGIITFRLEAMAS